MKQEGTIGFLLARPPLLRPHITLSSQLLHHFTKFGNLQVGNDIWRCAWRETIVFQTHLQELWPFAFRNCIKKIVLFSHHNPFTVLWIYTRHIWENHIKMYIEGDNIVMRIIQNLFIFELLKHTVAYSPLLSSQLPQHWFFSRPVTNKEQFMKICMNGVFRFIITGYIVLWKLEN